MFRLTDLADLCVLWERYCEETGGESTPRAFLEELQKMVPMVGYHLIVLEVEGRVVAFTEFYPTTQPFYPYSVVVSRFSYVLPEYRPNAGLLFKPMFKMAKIWGAKEIHIACKKEKVSFWKKHKFTVTQYAMKREVK